MGQQERAIVSKQMLYFINCDVKIQYHIDSAKNPVDLQTDGKNVLSKYLWYSAGRQIITRQSIV